MRNLTHLPRPRLRREVDHLETEVGELIAERVGRRRRLLAPPAPLDRPLATDDPGFFELVLALEETYDIEIADDEIESLHTGRDLLELVRLSLTPTNWQVA